MSAEMLRANAEATFSGLNKQGASTKVKKSVVEVADRAVKQWRDNAEGIKPIGIQTGIKWLDSATGGILEAGFWVISGKGGSCKSTMCRMIAEGVAGSGICCSIKTTEQTAEQYIGAMIAAEAGISVSNLNKPGFDINKIPRVESCANTVKSWPMIIDDTSGTRSEWMSWFKQSIADGSRLNIVDYLQHVHPENKQEELSDEKRVSKCSAMFQDQSKSTKVPAIVVSTLANDGNLRYSGNIHFDATLHLQMSKAEDFHPYENPCYIAYIQKARFSEGELRIPLYYHYGRLYEEEEYHRRIDLINGRSEYDFK